MYILYVFMAIYMEKEFMKVLIISDSHGRDENIKYVIDRVKPIDLLIHLGDFNGNYDYIKQFVDCPIEVVCGNNDFFCNVESDKLIKISDYKVFLTHGHRYGVSLGLDRIKKVGRQVESDIVMFGHTHRPIIEKHENLWIINPGSISLPRQSDGLPTYIIMDIDNSGLVHFTLNYI